MNYNHLYKYVKKFQISYSLAQGLLALPQRVARGEVDVHPELVSQPPGELLLHPCACCFSLVELGALLSGAVGLVVHSAAVFPPKEAQRALITEWMVEALSEVRVDDVQGDANFIRDMFVPQREGFETAANLAHNPKRGRPVVQPAAEAADEGGSGQKNAAGDAGVSQGGAPQKREKNLRDYTDMAKLREVLEGGAGVEGVGSRDSRCCTCQHQQRETTWTI